jgi:ABC-type multidrug transport system fused ATPase/permease subunit
MSGDILVDDISLLTLPRNTIRTRLLTKSQDVVILPGSIRLNVDPMQQHPDSAIIQALERVQLWPDPLMSRAGNDGDSVTINPLNTPLHENSLSAGQVQLLALARVLLRKDQSRILLLDEATSSLDVDTEKRIWDIIQSEFRNHTIVHVAHRLDTLLASDLVVVMDKGEVVEVGKPGALLRGEEGNGPFVKLAGR